MSSTLDRMRSIMEQEEIKPSKLTAEFGVSASSFTDWGKGKGSPSVAFLSKFAEKFNVSLDYLVFGLRIYHKDLEYSKPEIRELVSKFEALPPQYQTQLLAYIDGMLAVLNKEQPSESKDNKA